MRIQSSFFERADSVRRLKEYLEDLPAGAWLELEGTALIARWER